MGFLTTGTICLRESINETARSTERAAALWGRGGPRSWAVTGQAVVTSRGVGGGGLRTAQQDWDAG